MKKIAIIFVAFIALIAPISLVFAGTATGVLNISTTLVPSCSVTTTPVAFGEISSPSGANATGDVIVNCPSGLGYLIALDAGTNYDAGSQYRSLATATAPVSQISYNLAKLNGETWGDSDRANTFNFGTSLADVSNGSNQSHIVFGSLQGGSTVPGVYTGIVQVTVHY